MNQEKSNTLEKKVRAPQHPLFGISMRNWIRLVSSNGGIDKKYYSKAIFITVTSLCTAPARLFFKVRYGTRINDTTVKNPPVFIIGHWRTGTTYLHELLSQDPQFCYVSLWETLLPDSFLSFEQIKPFLARFLPSKRPMDEIKVEMDGPYEDEAALAVLLPWSFFHCLHFPKNAEEQYQKAVHFQGLTPEEVNQWKKTYLTFIKTVTFANQRKTRQTPHASPPYWTCFLKRGSSTSTGTRTRCIFPPRRCVIMCSSNSHCKTPRRRTSKDT